MKYGEVRSVKNVTQVLCPSSLIIEDSLYSKCVTRTSWYMGWRVVWKLLISDWTYENKQSMITIRPMSTSQQWPILKNLNLLLTNNAQSTIICSHLGWKISLWWWSIWGWWLNDDGYNQKALSSRCSSDSFDENLISYHHISVWIKNQYYRLGEINSTRSCLKLSLILSSSSSSSLRLRLNSTADACWLSSSHCSCLAWWW